MIIYTLLKLEFRNSFGVFSFKDKTMIGKAIATLLGVIAFYLVVLWASKTLFSMFAEEGLSYEILVFAFSALFLFLVFSGISSVTKVLYFKGDNEMLMRLPVKGHEVFISKTLYLLLNQIFTTSILIFPIMWAYAHVAEVPTAFLKLIPAVIALMAFIPFFLSNLLAIPSMAISNLVRHKFALVILMMIISVTAMFAIYMLLFESMIVYLKGQSFSVFDPEMIELFKQIALYCYPARYFANLVMQTNQGVALSMLLGISGVLFALTSLLIVFIYHKTLLRNVEIEGSAFHKKRAKNKTKSIFITLLRKEYLQVLRSVNYSFQYFVLAFSMPVMVYYCNKIAIEIGRNDIGEQIILGLTLLVMLIFNTVIISFSATSVTREGDNFYHTKVIPVSIRKQLFVKFTMYMIVSVLANIATLGLIVYTKQISLVDALKLYGIVQILAIGLTLRSMKFDIKRPRFNLSGEGELVNNNTNTTTSVLMGFVVSIFLGITAMLISYLINNNQWMYITIGIISIAFSAYCILSYTINLKKTYNKIT